MGLVLFSARPKKAQSGWENFKAPGDLTSTVTSPIPKMGQCHGVKVNGDRCLKNSRKGKKTCHIHRKDRSGDRRPRGNILVYSPYSNQCKYGAGIHPGFAEIRLKDWKSYNAMVNYKAWMKEPPEEEHTDGGHACSRQHNFYKAFRDVVKVNEIPRKAPKTNLFAYISEFITEIKLGEEQGCQMFPRCGKPVGPKHHLKCAKHTRNQLEILPRVKLVPVSIVSKIGDRGSTKSRSRERLQTRLCIQTHRLGRGIGSWACA